MINRAKESNRPDDNPEVIRKRLDVYKNDTAPLVDDVRTKFAAIKTAKAEQLGSYGRLYLKLEQYTQSGA